MRLFNALCNFVIRILDFTTGFHPEGYANGLSWVEGHVRESALGDFNQIVLLSDDQCNGPNNRSTWCNGVNINTDYEHIANTPPGITRKVCLLYPAVL
jgi:hypothetical protein